MTKDEALEILKNSIITPIEFKSSFWEPIAIEGRKAKNIVNYALKHCYKKTTKTYKMIGCTQSEFRLHIEKQFLKGMSWENRNLWHIDHIVPMSTAKTLDDVWKLNHFTNLKPLWAKDNLSKKNNITNLI
jgi:hypothetical protein